MSNIKNGEQMLNDLIKLNSQLSKKKPFRETKDEINKMKCKTCLKIKERLDHGKCQDCCSSERINNAYWKYRPKRKDGVKCRFCHSNVLADRRTRCFSCFAKKYYAGDSDSEDG